MDKIFIPDDYLPILLQSIFAAGFVVFTMVVSHYIGGKRRKIRTLRKEENFECGIEVKGNARFPFSVQYFLIAILFVLFDVEVIFFYPYAVNFREFGVQGFLGMLLFVSAFMIGFYYILRKGALDWSKT